MSRLRAPLLAPLLGVLAGVLAGLLAGCVPASPDADTYRDKAAQTLGSAVSDVRTVSRLLSTSYDGRMLRPTAVAQMRHSEGALGTATTAFTELNPPPSQDGLNQRARTLLGDAEDLVAQARVALERDDRERYRALVRRLERLAGDLEALEGQVS